MTAPLNQAIPTLTIFVAGSGALMLMQVTGGPPELR